MRSINVISIVAMLFVLSGCSTRSFIKPAPDKLTLGKSTRVEVLQVMKDQPTAQREITVNAEKVNSIDYFHGENPKFWGLVIKRRYQTYTTFNDVLVGDEYVSTYDGESTDFDTDKVPSIIKGKTTRNEVVALLGKPSGEVLYPLIADKQGRGLVYSYTWSRFAGMLTTVSSNVLVVTLNENNIVSNVSFKKNGVEQIEQTVAAAVPAQPTAVARTTN